MKTTNHVISIKFATTVSHFYMTLTLKIFIWLDSLFFSCFYFSSNNMNYCHMSRLSTNTIPVKFYPGICLMVKKDLFIFFFVMIFFEAYLCGVGQPSPPVSKFHISSHLLYNAKNPSYCLKRKWLNILLNGLHFQRVRKVSKNSGNAGSYGL